MFVLKKIYFLQFFNKEYTDFINVYKPALRSSSFYLVVSYYSSLHFCRRQCKVSCTNFIFIRICYEYCVAYKHISTRGNVLPKYDFGLSREETLFFAFNSETTILQMIHDIFTKIFIYKFVRRSV